MGAFIKALAPWLGTALGGPAGAFAVEAIGSALGLSEKTEGAIKAVLEAGSMTPEQMNALKLADQQFAIRMQELGFTHEKDLESLAVQDRDSARKREIEVKDHTPRNLAYGITVGFFLVLFTLMFVEIPSSTRDILNIMLGSLGGGWISVNAYFFGTTANSRAKTELLARSNPVKE